MDGVVENSRKRARKGTSCLQCRRRKLRCDGLRPVCTRCEKSSDVDTCEYKGDIMPDESESLWNFSQSQSHHHAVAPVPKPSRDLGLHPDTGPGHELQNAFSIIQSQQLDVSRLVKQNLKLTEALNEMRSKESERLTETQPPSTDFSYISRILKESKKNRRSENFRGSGFKTSFWGFTHPMSLTSEFELLNEHSQGFLGRHPMLNRAVNDMKLLDKRRKIHAKEVQARVDLTSLFQILPNKDVLDSLVKLYLETLGHSYNVFHVPSFWNDYRRFQINPLSEAHPSFVVILLLMASATICIQEPEETCFMGENTSNREMAEGWIASCERWLQLQSQKRLTLALLQIRCLLIIAKFMIGCKTKRWYTETGALVRFAFSMGLHVDPQNSKSSKKMTIFDFEMRRRIWGTIVELEIEACCHRGMPTSVDISHLDCACPHNVEDDALVEGMDHLPCEQEHDKFSSVSGMIQHSKTRGIRMKLLNLLNAPENSLSPTDFLWLEQELLQHVQNIPQWKSLDACQTRTKSVEFVRAHSRLQLQQFLLLLYRKGCQNGQNASISRYARNGCFNSAADIIMEHQSLTADNSFIIVCLRGDVVQAALSLCFDLSISDISPGSVSFRLDPLHFYALIESALSSLEHRVVRIGGVYRRYWVLASAYAAVKTRFNPTRATEYDRINADKISSMVYKMLSLQADRLWRNELPQKDTDKLSVAYCAHDEDLPLMNYGMNTTQNDLIHLDDTNLVEWNWEEILEM